MDKTCRQLLARLSRPHVGGTVSSLAKMENVHLVF